MRVLIQRSIINIAFILEEEVGIPSYFLMLNFVICKARIPA